MPYYNPPYMWNYPSEIGLGTSISHVIMKSISYNGSYLLLAYVEGNAVYLAWSSNNWHNWNAEKVLQFNNSVTVLKFSINGTMIAILGGSYYSQYIIHQTCSTGEIQCDPGNYSTNSSIFLPVRYTLKTVNYFNISVISMQLLLDKGAWKVVYNGTGSDPDMVLNNSDIFLAYDTMLNGLEVVEVGYKGNEKILYENSNLNGIPKIVEWFRGAVTIFTEGRVLVTSPTTALTIIGEMPDGKMYGVSNYDITENVWYTEDLWNVKYNVSVNRLTENIGYTSSYLQGGNAYGSFTLFSYGSTVGVFYSTYMNKNAMIYYSYSTDGIHYTVPKAVTNSSGNNLDPSIDLESPYIYLSYINSQYYSNVRMEILGIYGNIIENVPISNGLGFVTYLKALNSTISLVGNPVYFEAESEGGSGNYHYNFSFGDGTYLKTDNGVVSHVYNDTGIYDVYVKGRDGNGNASISETLKVIVEKPIHASLNISENVITVGELENLTINATGGSGDYTYTYYPGNGMVIYSHMNRLGIPYSTPGIYSVYAVVTDNYGISGITNKVNVTVENPIIANLTVKYNQSKSTMPMEASFNAEVKGGDGVYTYTWYFGDGSYSSTYTNETQHYYQQPGAYIAYVVVMDSNGIKGKSNEVSINVKSTINVTLTSTGTKGTIPYSVVFTAQASGGTGNYTYTWYPGNGVDITTRGNSLIYNYTSAGTYNAYVEVKDNQSNMGISNIIKITATYPPVKAVISIEYGEHGIINGGQSVNITGNITGGAPGFSSALYGNARYSVEWYVNGAAVDTGYTSQYTYYTYTAPTDLKTSITVHVWLVAIDTSTGETACSNEINITVEATNVPDPAEPLEGAGESSILFTNGHIYIAWKQTDSWYRTAWIRESSVKTYTIPAIKIRWEVQNLYNAIMETPVSSFSNGNTASIHGKASAKDTINSKGNSVAYNRKKALLEKVKAVSKMVYKGDYNGAAHKLERDILPKLYGRHAWLKNSSGVYSPRMYLKWYAGEILASIEGVFVDMDPVYQNNSISGNIVADIQYDPSMVCSISVTAMLWESGNSSVITLGNSNLLQSTYSFAYSNLIPGKEYYYRIIIVWNSESNYNATGYCRVHTQTLTGSFYTKVNITYALADVIENMKPRALVFIWNTDVRSNGSVTLKMNNVSITGSYQSAGDEYSHVIIVNGVSTGDYTFTITSADSYTKDTYIGKVNTASTPLSISGIGIENTTSDSMAVEWNSSVPADSQASVNVEGLLNASGYTTIYTDEKTTMHTAEIYGLGSGTSYRVYTSSTYIEHIMGNGYAGYTTWGEIEGKTGVSIAILQSYDLPYDSITHEGGGHIITAYISSNVNRNTTLSYWNTQTPDNVSKIQIGNNVSMFEVNLSYLIPDSDYGYTISTEVNGTEYERTYAFTYLKDSSGDGLSNAEKVYGWEVEYTALNGSEVSEHVSADPGRYSTDGLMSDYLKKEYALNPERIDTASSGMIDGYNLSFVIPDGFNASEYSKEFNYLYEPYDVVPATSIEESSNLTLADTEANSNLVYNWSVFQNDFLPLIPAGDRLRAVICTMDLNGTYMNVLTVVGKLSIGANPLAVSTTGDGIADGNAIDPMHTLSIQVNVSNVYVKNPTGNMAVWISDPADNASVYSRSFSNSIGLNYVDTFPVNNTEQYHYLAILTPYNDSPVGGIGYLEDNGSNIIGYINNVDLSSPVYRNGYSITEKGNDISIEMDIKVVEGGKASTYLVVPKGNATLTDEPNGLQRYSGDKEFDMIVMNVTGGGNVSVNGTEYRFSAGLDTIIVPRMLYYTSMLYKEMNTSGGYPECMNYSGRVEVYTNRSYNSSVSMVMIVNTTIRNVSSIVGLLLENSSGNYSSYLKDVTQEVYTLGMPEDLLGIIPNIALRSDGNYGYPGAPPYTPGSSIYGELWNSFTGAVSYVVNRAIGMISVAWDTAIAVYNYIDKAAIGLAKIGVKLFVESVKVLARDIENAMDAFIMWIENMLESALSRLFAP
ncbi:MAG: PKD domain-containing protein, partial [Thermoplasmata archaeon]